MQGETAVTPFHGLDFFFHLILGAGAAGFKLTRFARYSLLDFTIQSSLQRRVLLAGEATGGRQG